MSDEVLRQERRPINRAEIVGNNEVSQDFVHEQPGPPVPETRRVAPIDPRDPNAPIPMTGNIPQAVLNRIYGGEQVEADYRQPEQQQPKATSMRRPQPQNAVPPSGQLNNVLDIISKLTHTYEEITLPSLGKFYDGNDGPTNGILHIRPMTGEEEQILATQRFVKRGTCINMIFDKCIKEKFNSENFLAADRTFLLIYLRGISYGNDYNVELTCPFTEKKFNETIDLNLDVEYCPPDFGPQSLVGVLPKTNLNFRYHLAVGMDDKQVNDFREQSAQFERNKNDADQLLIYRTSLLVDEIEGITHKEEIRTLLKKLPSIDGAYIRDLLSEPPFGANTKITVTSPYTFEDFEIELPLEASFFSPKQKKDRTQA